MSTPKVMKQPEVAVFSGSAGVLLTLISLIFTLVCPFLLSAPDKYGYGVSYFIGDFFDFLTIPMALVTMAFFCGWTVIEPKEAVVLVFFGKFKGVVMDNGFFWIGPWVSKTTVTLKIENFASEIIKVNDKMGLPIQVGAVVSLQVVDPEAYAFNADDTEDLIMNGIDRVLRSTVSKYAYDISATEKKTEKEDDQNEEPCLRDDAEEITDVFKAEIQKVANQIGMEVLDANFTNLSYAQEIASVMLQRQQASAMMDARKMMVKSTVGVVKDAIKAMESTEEGQAAINMDETTKSKLAANLLTVMVSERGAQVTLPLQ